jgi:hypothetical protein
MEDDLRGIRTFDSELREHCGRDGYNGPLQLTEEKQQEGQTPMERFLGESGPRTLFTIGDFDPPAIV